MTRRRSASGVRNECRANGGCDQEVTTWSRSFPFSVDCLWLFVVAEAVAFAGEELKVTRLRITQLQPPAQTANSTFSRLCRFVSSADQHKCSHVLRS